MSWLTLPRKPEPEVMGDADEVEAYASAAAQAHLDAIDNTLVDQVLSLGLGKGRLLDIGTGPGGIPLKTVRRTPGFRAVGVDYSRNMILAAQRAAAEQGLAERLTFLVGDANRLPFPDASFDFVLSNSVLHHLATPLALLNEMARVARPDGVVLLRDLRRPSRPAFPFHVRWHGRHYSGLMYKLFVDSVAAAYTGDELAAMLRRSTLDDARVFFHQRTHLGFVRNGRRAAQPAGGKEGSA
jgi:ubiquinone/menaquinone biosynthesis C-methylase UbiE